MSSPIYILGGARTPMGSFVGPLKDVSATDLGVVAARAAITRSAVPASAIDHVVIGNVMQTSADAIYAARHIGLKSGVPVETPALAVNRLCGSGIQAAVTGAQLIQLGEASVVLAGGIESMSQAPHVVRGGRTGFRFGSTPKLDDTLWEALTDTHCGAPMAITAENCATKYGITRQAQDEFALRSQRLAAAAWAEGRLGDEVVPVELKGRKGVELFSRDDHMRPDTTIETLAKLPPVFKKDGGVTAGNASGIVDGGAAIVLASGAAAEAHPATPIGVLRAWAVVGVDPAYMGMGPAPAIRAVLSKTGLALADIDLFEINEAFAAQYLSVEAELGLDRDRVNVNGGAIAIGHPLGMSGTRLMITLLNELRRRGRTRGIASACIGGGQGIAALIETV